MAGFFRAGRYPSGPVTHLPGPAMGAPQTPRRGLFGRAKKRPFTARLKPYSWRRQRASQSSGFSGSPALLPALRRSRLMPADLKKPLARRPTRFPLLDLGNLLSILWLRRLAG
jgi:hypothetical protein